MTAGIGLVVPGTTGHGFTLPTWHTADHEKLVPVTVEFNVMGVVAVSEQIDWAAEHEMIGTGFTSTE